MHGAIASAIHQDLPDIRYWHRDWKAYNKLSKEEKAKLGAQDGPGSMEKRRPMSDEVEVILFSQVWGSTALGYGGMGGAAMTPAYTVIVEYGNVFCVYFGCGRLAYKIHANNQTAEGQLKFKDDVAHHNMAHCGDEGKYL